MTANAQPIFVGSVRNKSVNIITGATGGSGVGSSLLYQAGIVDGSRIHAISAVYEGTVTTQTILRLWRENASVYTLIAEIPLPLYTQVTGVPSPTLSLLDYAYSEFLDPADRFLTLQAGDSLYISVYDTIENNLHCTAWGGDY